MEQGLIKPIALPGIHEHFFSLFKKFFPLSNNIKVLDAGAGHGAFSQKLHHEGFDVTACDFFPESFFYNEIKCHYADLSDSLPFNSNLFDVVVSIEVMEHIHDHLTFLKESYRVLKKGGRLMISIPNILSLKSRWRYFFSGFYYSYKPIEHQRRDGLQHISARTSDQYLNLGYVSGFKNISLYIDKKQNSSRLLLIFYPLLWLYSKWKKIGMSHNTMDLLTGRILFIIMEKP